VRFWVGTTDNEWFRFLSHRRPEEVNFWQPKGEVTYGSLEEGSLFLFKLKRPYNHIAGGAFFIKSTALPLSMVWDTFGEKNGASTWLDFSSMVRRLASTTPHPDPVIGCTALIDPFFWPEHRWIASPVGWSGSIVRGRYYDDREPDGALLWQQVQERLVEARALDSTEARHGTPILVNPRLGQGAFRVVVTDAYARRCAVTGESTLPVLEAAHILPFSENGPHTASNGLLLRSDFHKLFDLGLITVTPDLSIEISTRIREEWFNGKAYYRLHGRQLASVPQDPKLRPSAAFLQWHNENRFRV
jgi:putative restriction endonuclease